MRIFFAILIGFCLTTTLFGQSPLYYAYGNISAVVSDGGGNYNVTITGFNGGYKQYPDANYERGEVPVNPTDFVVWTNCTRFIVVARVSTVPFVLRLTDVGGALESGDLNGARIAIIQESRFGVYNLGAVANVADGNAGSQVGISPFEHGCMQNYYRQQLQQAISGFLVFTSPRLSGDGTIGTPLDIAQQGATSGQVLKWNGTAWGPANDNTATLETDWEEEYFSSVTGTSINASGTLPTIDQNKRIVVYRTGVKMTQGVDYTISGNNLTLTLAAQAEAFTIRYK